MTNEKGVIAIIAFLTLGILLLLGTYFLHFSVTEMKISRSQEIGNKAYYVAEAGVHKAIWKLKNDDEWSTCFSSSSIDYNCSCEDWSAFFIQDTDQLIENSSLEVSIQNSECGRGQIIAASTVAFGPKSSQRVVKVVVFKAIGSLIEEAFLGDGNVETSQTTMNIFSGNLVANGNMAFEKNSVINVYDDPDSERQEGQVAAIGNITIKQSTINSYSICTANVCTELCEEYVPGLTSCPPEEVIIPEIDFDSDDPDSYENKAQQAENMGLCRALCNGVECSTKCVYTQNEFDELLWRVGHGGTLILEHSEQGGHFSVYYINGSFELKGKRNLIINGALAVDGNVAIGVSQKWGADRGFNQITVNDPGPGVPSGILTKGNVRLGEWSSADTTTIEGLVYTLGNFELTGVPNLLEIIGGKIVAGNFQLTNLVEGINIYFDSDIILEGIWAGPPKQGTPSDSPVVNIKHWEEAY